MVAGAAREWVERGGGNLWGERARELQLRIRDRFRVAVDRHFHRQLESDYSLALQRWIHGARKLWDDARPAAVKGSSSYKFYRKKVDKEVDAINGSIIVRMLQALAVPVIGTACHVFMHGLNRVQIYGAENLHQALLERPEGKPLITVSNHVASIDDPFVIASLLPPTAFLKARDLRWTLCATDRCFKNPMLSAFFRCVKVLPVSRGDGIYQKGMDMALSKLNSGGWVHIFPEGSRSRDGGRTMGTAKRGIGRLVVDADSVPIVVPFVHTGMQEIMPIGTNFPKIGKTVTVLIGDPISLDDLLAGKDNSEHVASGVLYDTISSRIGHRLQELKVQVDRLALEQPLVPVQTKDSGYGIWQQVDWEAFGMENWTANEQTSTVKQLSDDQRLQALSQHHERRPASRTIRMALSYEGGIVSRVRNYVNPSELMGFAARGLFKNSRSLEEGYQNIQDGVRLRIWRRFVEGNVLCPWNSI